MCPSLHPGKLIMQQNFDANKAEKSFDLQVQAAQPLVGHHSSTQLIKVQRLKKSV